ncbi:glycosyltransferase [Aliiroseovarius sp. YM-037]|uniref:glycosyltransferase n=1 Tax=Aliiroseovarius sp. YM-037 TaxID=3341728 RepID=UPI003A80D620
MPGAGTRTATTAPEPKARLLDLTRLISRVGRGPWTGVDRVEAAYLKQFLAETESVFGLIRVSHQFILLDRAGVRALHQRLVGNVDWGRSDAVALLKRRLNDQRRRAEADLRRLSIATCKHDGLGRMLNRHLPDGTTCFNVGHSNLSEEVLEQIQAKQGLNLSIMIHDTIPLDHPDLQRPEVVDTFEKRLRAVGKFADRVIYNSAQSRADAERYFDAWGRMPEGVVAHLGVDLPEADATELPAGLDLTHAYFVTTGTIEPRKNHALLLDVWEDLAGDTAHETPTLYIVGSRGWENEDVFRRLDALKGADSRIKELSGLSDPALAALLEGAAALLFPSLAEGYGFPPLEAAVRSVPVVVNDLPIYGEILRDIPVYALPNDRYSWSTTISKLAEQNRAGTGQRETGSANIPTWSDHFDLVLKVT